MTSPQIRLPRAVTTITPQRISFAGGGTDLPSFYSQHEGGVINSAIDQYIYVTVKRHSSLFNEQYRLSYSKTEHTNNLDDIENQIARECLRLLKVNPPVYISTAADLPASSGLGSSSSFAVGLLHALHHLKGERVSPGQLAEEACHVEINVLGNPIGKQDQYAVAFGGINHLVFRKNGRVEIDHLVLEDTLLSQISENSLLIWTGIQRDSASVLSKQSKSISNHVQRYELLKKDVYKCKQLLLGRQENFLAKFGALLNNSWATKKSLESSISSAQINDIHDQIISLGGYGGKLSGAGGGGFFYEIVPHELHPEIINRYGPDKVLKVAFEPHGSRLLSEVF